MTVWVFGKEIIFRKNPNVIIEERHNISPEKFEI